MKKIIVFILLISSYTYAQTGQPVETNSSKIKVYTPATSSVTPTDNSYKWTLKTDLLSFVGGEFPVIGEYRFAKKLSLEASAGATFGLLDKVLFEEFIDEEYTSFETKAALGTAFRAGIKYYPSSDYDALEGWAFGLQVFSKTIKKEYLKEEYYNLDPTSGEDSKSKTGFALTISKQVFSDSNISSEFFIGLGFTNVKHDFLTMGYIPSTQKHVIVAQSTEETVPYIQLGYRIGFGN